MGSRVFIDYVCPADGVVRTDELTSGQTTTAPAELVCFAMRPHGAGNDGSPAYIEVCQQIAVREVRVEEVNDPAAPVAATVDAAPVNDQGVPDTAPDPADAGGHEVVDAPAKPADSTQAG